MRLDKYLAHTGLLSRREAARAVRAGEVTVDGVCVRSPDAHIDEETQVRLRGKILDMRELVYIMLNKPQGYVSATDDPREKTVLDLIPERYTRRGIFPCGRLDKDTVGLVILTNDGSSAHRLLAPKSHAEKVYSFECADPLEHIARLEAGVEIAHTYMTMPCSIKQTGERMGEITLTEGKYHQIKQMFASVGNRIVYLERISFAGIVLDPALERGEWRELTPEEVRLFTDDKSSDI